MLVVLRRLKAIEERDRQENDNQRGKGVRKGNSKRMERRKATTERKRKMTRMERKTHVANMMELMNGTIVPTTGKKEVFVNLVDSGASGSLFSQQLTDQCEGKTEKSAKKWTTQCGHYATTNKKRDAKFTLPLFTTHQVIMGDVHIMKKISQYDAIIGRDILQQNKIDILNSELTFAWDGIEIPMVPKGYWSKESTDEALKAVFRDKSVKLKAEEQFLVEAKYEKMNVDDVINNQQHLKDDEKIMLKGLLEKYKDLFQGKIGVWPGEPIKLRLKKQDVEPFHAKPYRVPHSVMKVFQTEIERLVELGVLKPHTNSEWAAPTFGIPKKNGEIRIMTDFRKINESLKRSLHPLPLIREILDQIRQFRWVTVIDLVMAYYCMGLLEKSKDILTKIVPWGKYSYQVLPMGVSVAMNIFQERMSRILSDIPCAIVYMDNIIVVGSGSLEEHLKDVAQVLKRMREYGMHINPNKSAWAKDQLEYLGFTISRDGIKPQQKKVDAILKTAAPTNQKQVRQFLGMANYYKDMWGKRAHILAPLSALTGKKKKKFIWENEHQK
mmetsp:Transcript_27157/g.39950  ORF Transcript_27157/g.39950 Transcript_27157/m.39950 type:complete len:553 (-) Transcript_27157:1456-3114(-)